MLEILIVNYIVAALSGLLVGSISIPLTTSRSVTFGLTLLHSILGGSLLGVYLSALYDLPIPVPLVSTLTAITLSIIVGELMERGFSEDMSIAFSVSIATTMTIIFGYLSSLVSSIAFAKAWAYIAGTSTISSIEDILRLLLGLSIVVPTTHLLFKEFKYIAFDPDGAEAMGLNIRFYRYVFYSLTAISSSILSSTIGVLATHVILAIPGIIYMRLFRRLNISASYLLGVMIMVAGYLLASLMAIPPSGGVGLTSIIAVLGVTVYGRRT
ncbi:MAG: iron chelate uptake ABC transporter family permease subunit [Candidatus Caldarchaeales archaeon]